MPKKSQTGSDKKATANKKPAAKPKTAARQSPTMARPRRIRLPRKKFFRLKKRTKINRPPLPGAFRIFWRSLKVLKNYWKVFLVIIIIYAILNLLLVKGLAGGSNITTIKDDLQAVFHGTGGQLATGLTVFTYLIGGSGNTASASSGVYQSMLVVIVSLATIWALREVHAERRVRARDSFYKGMYPLVPFVLVFLVIMLQLLPLMLGAFIYYTVINAGIAIHAPEKILFVAIFAILGLISLYMICSSTFALLIATLPDMTPMKALRSARQLVAFRRFSVFRKIIFLPIIMLILMAIIMFPIILWATAVSVWAFFVLSILALIVVNSYFYTLYRELLV